MEYPDIIKELVKSGGFNYVHQDNRLISKEMLRIKASHKGFDEVIVLQIWFDEEGYQIVLEMIDSKGEPRYIGIHPMINDENIFIEKLHEFISANKGTWFKKEMDEILNALEIDEAHFTPNV